LAGGSGYKVILYLNEDGISSKKISINDGL